VTNATTPKQTAPTTTAIDTSASLPGVVVNRARTHARSGSTETRLRRREATTTGCRPSAANSDPSSDTLRLSSTTTML
jgi:hypothetical protein